MTATEGQCAFVCPDCERAVSEAKPEIQDDPAISFTVTDSGEIVAVKTEKQIEYTLRPCGHTFVGTYEHEGSRSLHRTNER